MKPSRHPVKLLHALGLACLLAPGTCIAADAAVGPPKGGEKAAPALVHLADNMTRQLMIGNFSWDDTTRLDSEIINILRLGDEEYLENFIYSYKELFENQLEAINI